MSKYYFTFGSNQANAGYCQVIEAENISLARAKMVEVYGDKWAFSYTEEEWTSIKNDKNRCFVLETELSKILKG